jgi:hypothetical protein
VEEANNSYSRESAAKWKAMETILQWAWRAWLRGTSSALRLRSAHPAVICAITIACRTFLLRHEDLKQWKLEDYVDTDIAEVLRAA